jgi:hypothetical protein
MKDPDTVAVSVATERVVGRRGSLSENTSPSPSPVALSDTLLFTSSPALLLKEKGALRM